MYKKYLITSYYQDNNPDRQKEIHFCLKQNIANKQIDKIILLAQSPCLIDDPKITPIMINIRPTYHSYFETANRMITDRDSIAVIANSDIYFDESLCYLDRVDMTDKCFALTRYDVNQDGTNKFFNRRDSQDTWIFKVPIKNIPAAHFPNGKAGADNRIAYEIESSGYCVLNPSLSIRSFHYHLTGVRNYNSSEPVPRPYKLLNQVQLDI